MKASDLRNLSIEELKKVLKEKQESLLKLRIKKKIEGLPKPTELRDLKRDIARVQTIINEKLRSK